MMTNEGSTKIVIFMNPGAVVLVQGRGLISHIVNMYYLLLYHIQHIAIVLRDYDLCCFTIPWLIFIYSMMGLLYKYESF